MKSHTHSTIQATFPVQNARNMEAEKRKEFNRSRVKDKSFKGDDSQSGLTTVAWLAASKVSRLRHKERLDKNYSMCSSARGRFTVSFSVCFVSLALRKYIFLSNFFYGFRCRHMLHLLMEPSI